MVYEQNISEIKNIYNISKSEELERKLDLCILIYGNQSLNVGADVCRMVTYSVTRFLSNTPSVTVDTYSGFTSRKSNTGI